MSSRRACWDSMERLSSVRYVSVDGLRDASFEACFSGLCEVLHSADRDAAVAGSDVVITATPGSGPLFDANAVRPGTHLNCVGADTKGKRELPEGLMKRDRLFVDDRTQAIQIGENQRAYNTPHIKFCSLFTGRHYDTRKSHPPAAFHITHHT